MVPTPTAEADRLVEVEAEAKDEPTNEEDGAETRTPHQTDLNFELWRQNLNLVALALDVQDTLAKDIKRLDCKDSKHFYVLAQLILSSLSDWPRAIAVASSSPDDITPFQTLERAEIREKQSAEEKREKENALLLLIKSQFLTVKKTPIFGDISA